MAAEFLFDEELHSTIVRGPWAEEIKSLDATLKLALCLGTVDPGSPLRLLRTQGWCPLEHIWMLFVEGRKHATAEEQIRTNAYGDLAATKRAVPASRVARFASTPGVRSS